LFYTVSPCFLSLTPRLPPSSTLFPYTTLFRSWTWSVIAALAVGVLVWGLLIWSVTFHRKKKGDKEFPRQFQYNVPLELFAVGLPTVMVCALFYFTVSTETDVVRSEKPNPDVTVDVVAFQWNWEFRYQGEVTPDGEVV